MYNAEPAPADPLDTRLVRGTLFLIGFLLPYVMIEPAPIDLVLAFLPIIVLLRTRIINRTALLIAAAYFAFSCLGISLSVMFGDMRPGVLLSYVIVQIFLLVGVISLYEVFRRSEASILLFFRAFVIGAVISTVIVLALHFSGSGWEAIYRDEFKVRLSGFYKDPNVLGPYLIFPFAALLFSARDLGLSKPWTIFALPVFILIIMTLSRAAMGGALVTVAATLALTMQIGLTRNSLTTGSVLLLLAVPVTFANWEKLIHVVQKMEFLTTRLSLQSYDTHRLEEIKNGILLGVENPFGIDPGIFGKIFNTSNPHNLFVGKLVDAGLIPAVIMVGFLLYPIARAVQVGIPSRNKLLIVLAGTLLTHVAISMVIYSHHWRHMLFLSVATIAYSQHVRSRSHPSTNLALKVENPSATQF